MEVKICIRCKQTLPISEFFKDKNSISGLVAYCKKCFMESCKKSYLKHRDNRLVKMKEWGQHNKEKKKEVNKNWADSHPDYFKEYRETHPKSKGQRIYRTNEEIKEQKATDRKLKLKNIIGKHNRKDITNIMKLQKVKCITCKTKLEEYHVDHIIPISKGGSNYPSNLQLLCPDCNIKKSNKLPEVFMRENGFLL